MSEVDVLRGIPLFAGLTELQLAKVAQAVKHRRAPDGAVVLREGDTGESLFILARGSVQVTKRLGLTNGAQADGGKQKTLVQLSAPQFFGEMGLLEDAERSATITTVGECELLEITRDDFEQLAEEDHLLGYRVVRNIAEVLAGRLRNTNRDVLKLTVALSLALGNR